MSSTAWWKSPHSSENAITRHNNGFPPRQTGEAMAVRSTSHPLLSASGPRVAVSGLGLIPLFPYSAPYEDGQLILIGL